MRSVLGRLSSNKENAYVHPHPKVYGGATTKPRLLGIGRAPQARSKATPAVVSTKIKYGRRESVVRAKRASSTVQLELKSEPSAPAVAPISVATLARSAPEAPDARIDRPDTHRASLVVATPSGEMSVPLHLPQPDFPPLTHLTLGADTIPIEYVRRSISPFLSRIFLVSSLFEPFPWVPSPPTCHDAYYSTLVRKSFAFGIRSIVHGRAGGQRLTELAAGYEPDVCLAIKKLKEDAPFRLVPISYVVFAATCVHFPQLPQIAPTGVVRRLAKIREEPKAEVERKPEIEAKPEIVMPPSPVSIKMEVDSDTESESAVSEAAALDVGPYLHLPVLAIELPDPQTFELVHARLHSKTSRWQPILLDLSPAESSTPRRAKAALSRMCSREHDRRLHRIRGVWQNMCALGVHDQDMWNQLGSSWAMLVNVLVQRAMGQ